MTTEKKIQLKEADVQRLAGRRTPSQNAKLRRGYADASEGLPTDKDKLELPENYCASMDAFLSNLIDSWNAVHGEPSKPIEHDTIELSVARAQRATAEDAPNGSVENGEKITDEMVESPVFRAAAASEGTEKTRVLDQASELKRPLGKAKGSKGACSFYASSGAVYVDFHGGDAPEQIFLPETAMETYKLSSDPDPDGHYEIVNIKEGDVAQFLALRRKPRW